MRNPLVAPELRELLQEGRFEDLRSVIEDLHPNDAASILSGLDDREIVQILELLPIDLERDLFVYFEPDLQEEIVLGSGRARVRALLRTIPSDERYDLLDKLDDRIRDQIMPLLEQAARADLARRELYDDDQVGSILSTEYCTLRPDMTVPEAINELRRQEPSRETIYYAYVVDDEGRLIGFVSLRDLIMARDRQKVSELMRPEPKSVLVTADQQEAATIIHDYDLLALPVVDEQGKMIGMLTFDDAADIQEQEDTEDIERMAGVTGEAEEDGGYLAESVGSQIRRRVPLIALLALFNLSTAAVIQHYEHALPYALMIALLPIVMATGGMVGTQAASLTIRGLTLGDVQPKQLAKVVWKEFRVGLGMAAVLSAIVFGEAVVLGLLAEETADLSPERLTWTGFSIAIAMATHVLVSGAFGASVPILARAIGRDPAMVSTPLVTVFADLAGSAMFCAIVLAML